MVLKSTSYQNCYLPETILWEESDRSLQAARWSQEIRVELLQGIMAYLKSFPKAMHELLRSQDSYLFYADPNDTILGTGYHGYTEGESKLLGRAILENPRATEFLIPPENWGANLFGLLLMEARQLIRQELPDNAHSLPRRQITAALIEEEIDEENSDVEEDPNIAIEIGDD